MNGVNSPPLLHDVLPPPDPKLVLRYGIIAVAICGIAALIGMVSDASIVNRLRLLLTAAGMLTASCALTLRPTDVRIWLLAALTSLLAWPAMPSQWDSMQMVARVLAVLALVGAGLMYTSPRNRAIVISVFIFFHFGNMLVATTSPDPRPWVTEQAMARIYAPYMRFMYLGNAYHFYSPEPGPSSHLFCLITWELDEPELNKNGTPKLSADGTPEMKAESGWVDLPNRHDHYKDPLGLAYYRRLSITELVSVSLPSSITLATYEKSKAWERRRAVSVDPKTPIPLTPEADPIELQYRIPRADISRWLIPSYTKHIAATYSTPGRKVISVKLYRVEHRVLPMQYFIGENPNQKNSPFTPLSYRPYYLGDYTPDGTLRDPQDPMLYWLVPILPVAQEIDSLNKKQLPYIDYMSRHAGFQFDWKERP